MKTLRDGDGACVQSHKNHAKSPTRPEGKDAGQPLGQPRFSAETAKTHPYNDRFKIIRSGCGSQQRNAIAEEETQSSKTWPPMLSPHLRPQPQNEFDVPIQQVPTVSTSTSGNDGDSHDLWKVRVAGGGYLESSSYTSQHDDAALENRVLGRLKLNNASTKVEEDKGSSTATTKISNSTFQKRIQRTNKCSLTATSYYRPVDSLANDGTGYHPTLSPNPPRTMKLVATPATLSSGKGSRRSRGSRFKGSKKKTRDDIITEPSDLSVTIIDTLPSGLSSLSYNESLSEDEGTPHVHTTPARRSNINTQQYLRQNAIIKSASESDDDSELKRMECVSRTFQRKDCDSEKKTSRQYSKQFSAVPLSGIGVGVSRNIEDQHHRVHTPREAANASCSISSLMGEIFGATPRRDDNNSPKRTSPFNIMKNMLCSPEGIHNLSSAKNTDNRKSAKNNVRDHPGNWSIGADVRSQSGSQYIFDGNERGEPRPCSSSSRTHKNRSKCCSSQSPVRNIKSRPSLSNRSGGNRNISVTPSVDRRYRYYHRDDLSYYGTEAGTSFHQPPHYFCADDGRSDTVSQLSEPFQDRKYRDKDSPFVHRIKSSTYEDRYGDDDTSYR